MFTLQNFIHYMGNAYTASLPEELRFDDECLDPGSAALVLLEDGNPLGPVCVVHQHIADVGLGRYCKWQDTVYLSSSDNSPIPENGREYTVGVGEPALIGRAMRSAKPNLTPEQIGLAKECLRNVYRSGQIDTLDEAVGEYSIEGTRVLEVGAGDCWIAPFFLATGAASYTGMDIRLNRECDRIFDRRHAAELWRDEHYIPMPMELGEFLDCFDGVQIIESDFSQTELPSESFNFIFMRAVSEHLLQFRACMREIARLATPGAMLYLSHGSYHSWNGHHVAPHTISEIDEGRPEQLAVMDWNHLRVLVDNDRSDHHNLNYLRLHELMDILSSDFEIESVHLHPSSPAHGGDRLTEQLTTSLPHYYQEELLTEMAYVRARRRPLAPSPDIERELAEESEFVMEAWRDRIRTASAWLREGGDLLSASRRSGFTVADLVELKAAFEARRADRESSP